MDKNKCCSKCHNIENFCVNCLGEEKNKLFKKDTAIHIGYLALHIIQIILIVKV